MNPNRAFQLASRHFLVTEAPLNFLELPVDQQLPQLHPAPAHGDMLPASLVKAIQTLAAAFEPLLEDPNVEGEAEAVDLGYTDDQLSSMRGDLASRDVEQSDDSVLHTVFLEGCTGWDNFDDEYVIQQHEEHLG
jgi:hypothetical protein